jgi:hypothetical protein
MGRETVPPDDGPGAFAREADLDVDALFPWRETSPENYAARHAHCIGCYSFHLMRFRDPEIGRWARRLGEILTDAEEMERCRREYLTPQECAEVQKAIADISEHGW